MGCDYYIIKFLNIYYNDIDYLVVELERENGYYNFQYDEDCDDYIDKENEYIKDCLTPEMKPIIINGHKLNGWTKFKYNTDSLLKDFRNFGVEIVHKKINNYYYANYFIFGNFLTKVIFCFLRCN